MNFPNQPSMRYTISFSHNAFIWLPAKTGTNTLSWIIPFFDFASYYFLENKFVHDEHMNTHFGHEIELPPNHESLLFLCSIRNPYESIFSFFKMAFGRKPGMFNKEYFAKYMQNEMKISFSKLHKYGAMFTDRVPDYIIRTENFYSDMVKVPFIRDSKLNQCGILEEMCEKKMNKTFDTNSRDFFTDEHIEEINKSYSKIFEIGGYEKW